MTVTDLSYDPYDFDIDADPYPIWKRLREEAPLYYNAEYDFFALSRFDDVERCSVDWRTYISGKGSVLEIIKGGFDIPPGNVLFEDPPAHDLHRGLLSRVFTPKRMLAIEPQVREFCARSLDPLVGSGSFDFVVDLGAQMPMRTIGMLLGIPEEDQEAIRDRLDAGMHLADGSKPPDPDAARLVTSGDGFEDYIDWRATHPSDDLMTDLLNAEFEDVTGETRKLTREEVLNYVGLIAGAGNETTTRLIGWTGKVLAEHPDQRRELAEDPSLIPNAIEELYLRARAMPNQRGRGWAREAADIYRQVIAKDARFAPAYAGLAAADAAMSVQGFRDDHADEIAEMRAAAESAIRLDPLLAEAHDALGMVYMRDGKWAQSEASFRRAIELDRNSSEAYNDFSTWLLLPLGRIDEAVHQLRLAEKADPLSPFIQQRLAATLILSGRYEEAAAHCADEAECLGRARLGQGRIDEAIRILSALNETSASESTIKEFIAGRKDLVRPRYLGYAYGRAGRRADAERLAVEVAPNAFSQALIYAGVGDKERTLQALDRVAGLGAVRIGQALNSPEFALLRGDPRVKALRKKVGLPE